MKKKLKTFPIIPLSQWLKIVEFYISEHSTPPRKSGKYKGHSSTNERLWIADLTIAVGTYIASRNQGKAYDNNMAVAAMLGLILSAWFANVQRAKVMDPNRPLALRRKAYGRLERHRALLVRAVHSDKLMGDVWGEKQPWNFPFGRGAKGGKFV